MSFKSEVAFTNSMAEMARMIWSGIGVQLGSLGVVVAHDGDVDQLLGDQEGLEGLHDVLLVLVPS